MSVPFFALFPLKETSESVTSSIASDFVKSKYMTPPYPFAPQWQLVPEKVSMERLPVRVKLIRMAPPRREDELVHESMLPERENEATSSVLARNTGSETEGSMVMLQTVTAVREMERPDASIEMRGVLIVTGAVVVEGVSLTVSKLRLPPFTRTTGVVGGDSTSTEKISVAIFREVAEDLIIASPFVLSSLTLFTTVVD